MNGLKSRPELNGKIAKCESFIEQSGRYVCVLEDGSNVALKPDNLTVVAKDTKKTIEEEKDAKSAQERLDDLFFEKLMLENAAKAQNAAKPQRKTAALGKKKPGFKLSAADTDFEEKSEKKTFQKNSKQRKGFGAPKGRTKP